VKYRTLSSLLLAALASPLATAKAPSPSHWYFQGEVGYSALSEACSDGYTSCEDTSPGAAVAIGYQHTPHFALQGGYRYLGEFERSQDNTQRQLTLSAFDLTAVGTYPLSRDWSLYGSFGASLGQSSYNNGTVQDNLASNGTHLSAVIGGGARYRLNDQWQLYSGVQWSPDIVGSTTDATVLSLGMRYNLATQAVAPQVTVVQPQRQAEPTETVKEIVIEKTLVSLPSLTRNAYFDFNSVTLTPKTKQDLQSVIERLTTYPRSQVRLLGFADSTGSVEANQAVSERRVKEVADYLVAEGVLDTQITMESFGKVDPTHSNDTAEGRAMNRRVSLIMDAVQVEQTP